MSFSMPELLIVLLIVALLFGTRKLRSVGGDLGSAVRGFRKAMSEDAAAGGQSKEGPAAAETAEAPRAPTGGTDPGKAG